MKWFRKSGLVAAFLLVAPVAARPADITVFAAASLTNALQEVGKYYEARSGHTVAFSFAASSVLARQIEASGGADMFLSADSDWMNYLDARNLIDHRTRGDLLANHLVLIAPAGERVSLRIVPNFDLAGALQGRSARHRRSRRCACRQIRKDGSDIAGRLERGRRAAGTR